MASPSKNITPFSFVNSINKKTNYDIIEASEDEYNAFITNRAFSFFPDTIHFANEMNKYGGGLGNREQFDFYYHGLPKQNRWSKGKWKKEEAERNEKLDILRSHFSGEWSERKILEVIDLFSDDEIKQLKETQYKGGSKK